MQEVRDGWDDLGTPAKQHPHADLVFHQDQVQTPISQDAGLVDLGEPHSSEDRSAEEICRGSCRGRCSVAVRLLEDAVVNLTMLSYCSVKLTIPRIAGL